MNRHFEELEDLMSSIPVEPVVEYNLGSCLLELFRDYNSPFGTMNLFDIVREERNPFTNQVQYASMVFSVRCHWVYKLIRRRNAQKNEPRG